MPSYLGFALPFLPGPGEGENFLLSLELIPLNEPKPVLEMDLEPEELQEFTHLAKNLVTFHEEPPAPEPGDTNRSDIEWKAARFFGALFHFMIQHPAPPSFPWASRNLIAYAHTRLRQGHDGNSGITRCARALSPIVVHKTVCELVRCHFACMLRGDGDLGLVSCRPCQGELPRLSDADKERKRAELRELHRKIDMFLKREECRGYREQLLRREGWEIRS
ncbi:hypothetical protein C8A03DRAFT_35050 [Achaetomium macrosporum]|uniref:Uncharacterized protein n=1 Tax=Achaetomium macrosporum TaxID=79813 RepID=A0AAN7C8S4_9PEZI|nr:hypothetical protein C8A03DRAFT_35050 [Achaetomium macrosporum]